LPFDGSGTRKMRQFQRNIYFFRIFFAIVRLALLILEYQDNKNLFFNSLQ
jgi:hypothetical protein